MTYFYLRPFAWLTITLLAALALPVRSAEVFPANTSWSYFKATTAPSSPAPAWRELGFNDAAWLTGNAPFYYETSSGYAGNTQLGDMNGGYPGIFLRKTFNVTSPGDVMELQLDVQTDDGCIVWINGVEVQRVNVPGGELAYNATSLGSLGEPNVANTLIPDPTFLVAGANVIAVHALNASLSGSSDFLISLSLSISVDDQAPFVIETLPPPGSVVQSLDQISITFDDNVAGVTASDLLINGTPAMSVDTNSPRDYTFHFPQPMLGAVSVTWAGGHGITDTANPPNAFGGGSWSHTLDPNAPESIVLISELLADNSSSIDDEDGESSDWIEILNLGPLPVNLGGWSLTDDAGDLIKWQFPPLTLNAGQYLLVWASGKDRTSNPAALHTNFRLEQDGEYLALVNASGVVVSEFAPAFPAQSTDVSYGRDRANPQILGFFVNPTPGTQNSTSGPGFAPEPVFSQPGGVYDANPLSISISAPSGTVRYTTNGSDPTESSSIAGAPLNLTISTLIKARVFSTGLLPGVIVSQTYELIGSGLNGFESKLPLLVINTHGSGITSSVAPGGNRTRGSIVAIDTLRGRSSLDLPAGFQGLCQIEGRGQTSGGFAKRQYNLELNDTLGNDDNVPLLGLPTESDWVLNGPYSDKILLNNFLAFELFEQMGNYSVRRRFVELFLDTNGGDLDYPGDYAGVYVLLEKIKIDRNRVDIPQLGPLDNSEPELSGGYMFKKDKSSGGDLTFSTPSGQVLRYHEPKPREITSAQMNWLDSHVDAMEGALYASDWLTRTGTNHYSHYLDVSSFVDYHWIVEFAKQIDGYRISNYFSKDRGGKIREVPIWDWNLSFGNANYLDGGHVSGWYYPNIGAGDHIWLRRLISAPGDPDFNQAITDRWSELRTNVLNGARLLARVDELHTLLAEAAVRDNAKWGRWGVYEWPNPDSSWDVDYVSPTSYAALIQQKKNWIIGRYNWIDSQFLRTPTLSRFGGNVAPGTSLSISTAAGTVYYTLDGTDPRAPGGGLAPGVQTYSGAFPINSNIRVVARARSGNAWSGPTVATYVVNPTPLVISEIMYHPAAPTEPGPYTEEDFEFLEVLNTGPSSINLSGLHFDDGTQFQFTGSAVTVLPAGQRALIVKNAAAFASRYGALPNIAGTYTGNLDNGGERITLRGRVEEIIQSVRYNDGWYPITDGYGFSLVPALSGTPMPTWDDAPSWRPSAQSLGSPGASDPAPPAFPEVVINEALTHTDLPQLDTIELRNVSGSPADISGWFLTDDRDRPGKYRIPDDTVLGPNSLHAVTEEAFGATNGSNIPFQLRSTGDELFLFSADAAGDLTGYRQGFDFGAAINGSTFGRHVISTGKDHFVRQTASTLGSDNGAPAVGPVVINEIMYHPPDLFVNNAFWNNTEHEFIELRNITSSPVPLYDPAHPTHRWMLRDAVSFTFPEVSIPALANIVIVGFDPAAEPALLAGFRAFYGMSPSATILGPFEGQLGNDSNSLELMMPDTPNPGEVPLVLIDKVSYEDAAPWASAADGQGSSLQRTDSASYGNDPANWFAAGYSPGTLNGINTPPVVQLTSPQNNTTISWPNPVIFAATASDDDDILRVEFYVDSLQVAEDDLAPYSQSWPVDENGLHQLYAVARDTRGGFATSGIVNVTFSAPVEEQVTLIPAGAVWKYLDDGSNQGTPWRNTSFNDSAWPSGPAQLGYGDGDEATVVGFGPNSAAKHPTTYFRHSFNITSAPAYTELNLALVRDDGAVVYLNGIEIFRSNIAGGVVGFNEFASSTTPNTSENSFIPSPVDPVRLQNGLNVIAVEVHQANATSSDMSFQLELTGKRREAVVNDGDLDDDGMPDNWELANGLDPDDPADADLDQDGDLLSNEEEYRAGTNPNDPNSTLMITGISLAGGVELSFAARASRSYTVQYSPSVTDGPWFNLSHLFPRSTNHTARVLDPAPASPRYYRLVTPLQP